MSKTIEVKLLGKDYRVACEPAEREALQLSLIHISEPRDRTRSRMPSSA